MEFDMTKVVEEITMQAIENQEEFIFETIQPYCENILQMKINKEYLKQILLNGMQKQQPCEDCISREEVLRHRHVVQNNDWIGCCVVRVDEITKLPSVTPSNDAIKEAYIKGYDYGVKDWFKSKTEPCEDCISRKEAINEMSNAIKRVFAEHRDIAEKAMNKLPSVTPQQRVGRWILEEVKDEDGRPYDIKYFCSECQAERPPIWDDYCGACGAKMEVEE